MSTTLLFYLTIEAISILFMFLAQRLKKKHNLLYWLLLSLSFVPLLILIGFRDITVGADTKHYTSAYYNIASGADFSKYGNWLSPGYIVLCKLVGLFSPTNAIPFYCIIGFLTLFFLYKAFKDSSKNPALSLYILFSTCLFYQSFNQARQMLAVSIVCYSFKFIKEKNIKKYLLFIILASLIHKSALIMIPFYFIANIKITKKNLIRYALMALFAIISYPIIKYIITMSSWQTYIGTSYLDSSIVSIPKFIFSLLLIVLCYVFSKNNINKPNIKSFFNLGIWYVIWQAMSINIYIIGRVSNYFYITFFLLIPNIYMSISDPKKKRIFIIIIALLFLIHHIFYFSAVAPGARYTPYSFFIGPNI